MKGFKVKLSSGTTAILITEENFAYLQIGTKFYTAADLIAGEKAYLQDGRGKTAEKVIAWNRLVGEAAAIAAGRVKK